MKVFALALTLAGVLPPVAPGPTADTGAVAAVRSFYAWDFAQSNGNWTTHFGQAKKFFRPSLYALLQQSLAKQAKTNEVILDFDPFVNAQSNASAYELGTPVDKGSVTLVPVTLTIPHSTSKTHLTMVVSLGPDGYAIYDVLYANPTFTLRGYLQKAVSTS
ncbi:MAG: hypothetical protein WAK16_04555 [Candidatus Cybelea sp.]